MNVVTGKSLIGKTVVSTTGMDLGVVEDLDFELGGAISALLVRVDQVSRDLENYVEDDLLRIPFENVRAVGKYIVVNFPK
ncbi:MAG: PRC-barrel domain-containing protein [archaeon]